MFSAHRLFSAGALAAAVLATSACAETYYRYPVAVPRVDQRAYSRGYDEGRVRGENDGRRNRPFDYSRYGEYRSADGGYRGGDRNAYRDLYRRGFVEGYNEGYRRMARGGYGGYPSTNYPGGRYGYGSPAAEIGYRDGFQQGRDDARDGDRYDPVRARRYREGDHDYNSRYGAREEYKREYRVAFQQGYEQGYRGSRR
jgi:hypothetical protein